MKRTRFALRADDFRDPVRDELVVYHKDTLMNDMPVYHPKQIKNDPPQSDAVQSWYVYFPHLPQYYDITLYGSETK